HVEVARFLREREVACAVDGEREDRIVAGEDRRGAVALVHVAIDDGDARESRLGLQRARGDGGVIEDAEAFAAIAERVVRAAGEVGAPAARERLARRGEGGTTGAARALHHSLRPWKTNRLLLGRRKRAAGHAPQVIGA